MKKAILSLVGLASALFATYTTVYAQNDWDPEMLRVLETLSPQEKALLEQAQNTVAKRLQVIFYNPVSQKPNDLDAQETAFRLLYRSVIKEVSHTNIPSVESTALLIWMEAMGKDPDSPFYDIPAQVTIDLAAENADIPIRVHSYQTCEHPSLNSSVVVMSVIVVGLLSRSGVQKLPPVKVACLTAIGLSLFSGCSSVKKFWDENKQEIMTLALEALRLWIQIETHHKKFQDRLQTTTQEFHSTLEKATAVKVNYNEFTKRQLYALLYDLVVGFLLEYHTDPNFQKKVHESLEKELAKSREGIEDDLQPDNANSRFPLQVEVIWMKLTEMVEKYVFDDVLKQTILNASFQVKTIIMEFIQKVYADYKQEWDSISKILGTLQSISQKSNGAVPFPPKSQRRDVVKIQEYIQGLRDWILSVKSGTAEGSTTRTLELVTQSECVMLQNAWIELTAEERAYLTARASLSSRK